MTLIIMILIAVVAFFSLNGLMHDNLPELRSYLLDKNSSNPTSSLPSNTAWAYVEQSRSDGGLDIQLTSTGVSAAGQSHLVYSCVQGVAYGYIDFNEQIAATPDAKGISKAKLVFGETPKSWELGQDNRLFAPDAGLFASHVLAIRSALSVAIPLANGSTASVDFSLIGFKSYATQLKSACGLTLKLK